METCYKAPSPYSRVLKSARVSANKKTARPEWTPKRAEDLLMEERLVSKLRAEFACFVHFAIGAFRNNSVAEAALPQDSRRHHPGLNERIRIVDRHVVVNFISNTGEFLNDVHVVGMEETSSSQPRRIDE